MTIDPEAVAALLLYVVAVGWAGMHILVHKRAVSAVAWLGLVVTAPVLGMALYAMVGVDRLGPRARARRDDEGLRLAVSPLVEDGRAWVTRRDPEVEPHRPLNELHHLLDRICPHAEVGGNDVDVLLGGDEAFPRMLAAIDAAESFVLLETYIWRSDAVGRAFLDALRRAAERGVDCHAIFDGFGAGALRRRDVREVRRAGVGVHPFSPARGRLSRLRINHHTHRKILVVDGVIAFTGGLNLAQAYATDADGRLEVRDHHFAVRGPVVQQFTQAFLEDLVAITDEEPDYSGWFPPVEGAGEVGARVIPSGPDDERWLHYAAVLAAISAARRRVRIATAFFIPEPPLSMTLEVAALGGVEVQLLVPRNSDHFFTDAARGAYLDRLLEAGVTARYAPAPFLHSKLMVIDGVWACVGSSNLDPLSLRLNYELNVGLEGTAVQDVDAAFDAEWEASEPVSLEQRRARPTLQKAWESFWALWTPLL